MPSTRRQKAAALKQRAGRAHLDVHGVESRAGLAVQGPMGLEVEDVEQRLVPAGRRPPDVQCRVPDGTGAQVVQLPNRHRQCPPGQGTADPSKHH